jgi:hypothetical protein
MSGKNSMNILQNSVCILKTWQEMVIAFSGNWNTRNLKTKSVLSLHSLHYIHFWFERALADQLENDPRKHPVYRAKICDFIAQNRDMFEPFIEDDILFDKVIALLNFNECYWLIDWSKTQNVCYLSSC